MRTVVDGSGNILEQNDYYPFGGRHKRDDYAFSDNNYRFNGKEEHSNYLGMPELGWTDFGARMYDTKLGRWFVVDPLAEKYYTFSPYVFCVDNPIKYVDPNGEDIRISFAYNVSVGPQVGASLKAFKPVSAQIQLFNVENRAELSFLYSEQTKGWLINSSYEFKDVYYRGKVDAVVVGVEKSKTKNQEDHPVFTEETTITKQGVIEKTTTKDTDGNIKNDEKITPLSFGFDLNLFLIGIGIEIKIEEIK